MFLTHNWLIYSLTYPLMFAYMLKCGLLSPSDNNSGVTSLNLSLKPFVMHCYLCNWLSFLHPGIWRNNEPLLDSLQILKWTFWAVKKTQRTHLVSVLQSNMTHFDQTISPFTPTLTPRRTKAGQLTLHLLSHTRRRMRACLSISIACLCLCNSETWRRSDWSLPWFTEKVRTFYNSVLGWKSLSNKAKLYVFFRLSS